MLISYRVYEPEIGQFVEEIKQLKKVEYSVRNKAYKMSFEDDTYVYVPKEHRLDKSILMKSIVNNDNARDRTEFNEYYSLACNCVALRRMDDITEAQLRINSMYSAEHYDDYGNKYEHVAMSDKVFLDTAHEIVKTRNNIYQFTVDGYDGTEMERCIVSIKNLSDSLSELCDTDKSIVITSQLKDDILSKVEF